MHADTEQASPTERSRHDPRRPAASPARPRAADGRTPTPGAAPGILATGACLPEQVVTNASLAAALGVTADWIVDRTGVHERRAAAPGEATSDLATHAARQALDRAGVDAADVGLIILGTSTPDLPLPATACRVQANLGAWGAYAMDLDAVCTGFVYALDVAHKIMRCDPAIRYAVVIGADTYSRILDYSDRRTSVLFGDGAGAVVLGRSADAAGIAYTRLGSDGRQHDLVRIPAGGSRAPASTATVAHGGHHFTMDGRAVRAFAERKLPELVADATAACGLTVADLDLLVPHQANVRLLREVTKELGFVADQVAISGTHYGNTGAASVPVTLDAAIDAGRVRPGARVLLAAFGGGMTWGSALITWPGGTAGQPTHEEPPA
ncbi:3-oxoacyl-ACP synthase III family protein [Micromonospora wenchangensis]|uniref:3-oxoacyl-ACP synthase III family protein n=1 Tax=Micromonospora wenchangensis TaxID=1185415 RepID=UPI003D7607FF